MFFWNVLCMGEMGDDLDVDLDELLDEVEEKFCSSDTPANESAATRGTDYSRWQVCHTKLEIFVSLLGWSWCACMCVPLLYSGRQRLSRNWTE